MAISCRSIFASTLPRRVIAVISEEIEFFDRVTVEVEINASAREIVTGGRGRGE